MHKGILLESLGLVRQGYGFVLATGMLLDGTTKRVGFKFYALKAVTLTDIDFWLAKTGTPSAVNLTAQIETDSSGSPSGTLVGTATAAFAAVGDGWQGTQALGSSAALTAFTPYWLVILVSSATTLDGTNYYQARQCQIRPNRDVIRQYNGTNWTTTATVSLAGVFALKDSAGAFYGVPLSSAVGNSARTDVFGTNRQGVRYSFGSQVRAVGASFIATKAGSPSALEVVLYEGSTEKASASLAAADISSQAFTEFYFSSPVTLAANTNIYVVLRQASDGGTDAADYDLRAYTINATYVEALFPPDRRSVSGTGNDPTALTVNSDEAVGLALIVEDPAADLLEPLVIRGGAGTPLRM